MKYWKSVGLDILQALPESVTYCATVNESGDEHSCYRHDDPACLRTGGGYANLVVFSDCCQRSGIGIKRSSQTKAEAHNTKRL